MIEKNIMCGEIIPEFLRDNTIVGHTIVVRHFGKLMGVPLTIDAALKTIVKGHVVVTPLSDIPDYGWVDSEFNIYHNDDCRVLPVDNQTPHMKIRVRKGASQAFFDCVLSSYRVNQISTPTVLGLIPLTHPYYGGDLLLKPGAINIVYDPIGDKVKIPIYFKDGILFSKHTTRKEVLTRKPFIVNYNNNRYELTFRDIMYQVLDFNYHDPLVLLRYDDRLPFYKDNCILHPVKPAVYDFDVMEYK